MPPLENQETEEPKPEVNFTYVLSCILAEFSRNLAKAMRRPTSQKMSEKSIYPWKLDYQTVWYPLGNLHQLP